MFEKRLKIFLLILSTVVILLLLRAAQLQVVEAAEWKAEASRTLQHDSFTQTTRGSILDRNGQILAKDRACVDACVDFYALTQTADSAWLKETATTRLRQRLGEAWSHMLKAARQKMVIDEMISVQALLDSMWGRLAALSGQTPEAIDDTRQDVQRRVELRKKFIWYSSYKRAMKDASPKASDPKWQRWLSGETEDVDEIDKYAVTVGEERQAHVILNDVSVEVQNDLGRHPEMYPGLKLMPGVRRYYPYDDVAPQLIGHIGKVLSNDLANDPDRENEARSYKPNDHIGRAGLEALCEPALRGTLGTTSVRGDDPTQNASTPPIPGQDVRASIDINVQRDIQTFFGDATLRTTLPDNTPIVLHHQILHGAAVVLDVKTNEVLALVSYPTYDANQFDELYQTLLEDHVDEKLKNRATESQFEPGSTVKPLVGLSAITQGVVKVHEGIECTGYLQLPDSHGKMVRYAHWGRCWVASSYTEALHGAVAHHPIPYASPHRGRFGNPDGFLIYSDGLERSCNVYFETIADRLGIISLSAWMRRFGLANKTGIGIEEGRGMVPADGIGKSGMPERTMGYLGGIGQGYIAVTPIQMANIASTIARGGIWMRPKLILPDLKTGQMPRLRPAGEITGPDRVDLHLDPEAMAACHEGMTAVVNSLGGTGQKARMDDLLVAGKTGTAQASPFRTVLIDQKTGKPLVDDQGHRQYQPYELGTIEHPNPELPWYRGSGPKENQIDHAWMIGFAPADKPRVAFAVLVEYGGSGGGAAADVVRAALDSCMLNHYLDPTPATTQRMAMIETGLMSGPATRDE